MGLDIGMRPSNPIRTTAGALALALLAALAFAGSALAAEALPEITNPGPQTTVAGKAIEPLKVEGTHLATLTDNGTLPAGLHVTKVAKEQWTITGTPTTPGESTVTLEATNEEKVAGTPATFKWTVTEPEALPNFEKPAAQTSTAGKPITTVIVKGTKLATMTSKNLPAGLALKASVAHPETEWEITGTPTTPKAATTVTLEASNTEKAPLQTTTFEWTVVEEPAPKPVETPSKPVEPPPPPPPPTIPSAGRLGTLPVQKPGKSLTASFLCEVASCKVTITATITAGKKKFKIHSAATLIKQGQKPKIALKLSKAQQALLTATLKKHKKVTAALAASIESSVGFQVTKALTIAVRR
jgi:hypothetical protein